MTWEAASYIYIYIHIHTYIYIYIIYYNIHILDLYQPILATPGHPELVLKYCKYTCYTANKGYSLHDHILYYILFIYCVYKVATARANPKGYQSFRPLCGVCSQMTKWFSILGVWMCLVLCRGTSVRSWNLLSDQLLPRSPRPE